MDRRTAVAALAGLSAGSAGLAAIPQSGRQVPGIYRFRVGRSEVTALLDGHLDIPLGLFGGDAADGRDLLGRAFLPPGEPVRTPVNAYAVNTGRALHLVDAGTNRGYLPTLAGLPEALAAADIPLEAVDTLLTTHLHPDHVGGAARDGRALFPRAELVVPEGEARFWLDPSNESRAPDAMKSLFAIAREAVEPYARAGRLRVLPAGEHEAVPGIEAVPLPGHTPGHTGYLVRDAADGLLIWGDLVHSAALQLPEPDRTIAFDVDGDAARVTRGGALQRIAADRLRVAGMHLPFPGVGRIRTVGTGFAFVPEGFGPL